MDKILRENQPKSLLRILQEKNEYISAPCNGNGTCGKCVVRFQSGATEPSVRDREIFRRNSWKRGTVLHVSLIRPECMKLRFHRKRKKLRFFRVAGRKEIIRRARESRGQNTWWKQGRTTRICKLRNLHRHRNNDSGGTACESGNRSRLPDCRIR